MSEKQKCFDLMQYEDENYFLSETQTKFSVCSSCSVADPDFELRERGWGEAGFDLLVLLAFLPSVISSFYPK